MAASKSRSWHLGDCAAEASWGDKRESSVDAKRGKETPSTWLKNITNSLVQRTDHNMCAWLLCFSHKSSSSHPPRPPRTDRPQETASPSYLPAPSSPIGILCRDFVRGREARAHRIESPLVSGAVSQSF